MIKRSLRKKTKTVCYGRTLDQDMISFALAHPANYLQLANTYGIDADWKIKLPTEKTEGVEHDPR